VIGGLKLQHLNSRSYADEAAWVAAFLLFISTLVSYLAIRNDGSHRWQLVLADWSFILGIATLMTSVLIAAIDL
jgi:hypothetical protein